MLLRLYVWESLKDECEKQTKLRYDCFELVGSMDAKQKRHFWRNDRTLEENFDAILALLPQAIQASLETF